MADRGRARDSRSRSPSKGGRKSKKEKKADREKKKDEARKILEQPDSDSSEEAHGTGSTVALPTDVQQIDADLINSLCRSINTMTTAMAKVEQGLSQVQHELRLQKAQIESVVTQVETIATNTDARMKQFEADMKAANDDIDGRLAKLAAATASSRPVSFASAAARGAAGSAGPAPTVAAGGPPAGGFRPTRVWIKGFKETLTTKYLNEYARKAADRLPPDLRGVAKTGAPGFGSAVFLDFPDGTLMNPIKSALIDMDLKHTDESGVEHSLRISTDQPLEVRHKGRALGELWKLVEPHLSGLPAASRPTGFKLGSSNGKLFLVLNNRPIELFSTYIDDRGAMHINPNLDNLGKYQVDEAMAQSWACAASRSAARGR
jgi:hypothetical protein